MKLLTYRRTDDSIGHGILTDDGTGVIELGDGDLATVVAAGLVPAAPTAPAQRFDLSDVTVLAPLQAPGKIICAASNYQEHIDEGGGTRVDKTRTSPKLFNKFENAIAGPDDTFLIPEISAAADWEVELAVVIGREGRNIATDDALDHVFGYATANDLSLRALDKIGFERDTENAWVGFFDWLEGKWADNSAPVGPYLVTADEIPDPQSLPIRLAVNGEIRQQSTTGGMIFTCAELIAFASRLCTLRPGDIILTGTPAGVGATTGTYLNDGDVMVAEVEGLGKLVTPVRTA
ncbi:fumarylacetoacetate hydrolase family protein [Nakamurella lactea]|uniref:fumarylacetoacetate hydrolase family protein n=1 Tax=Nakamurella lactea TaxID=459515 RepID=UPI00042746FE|nr:fumarylacetoacetate hydrolase family protein [Nakamurella lactea]